MGYKRCFTCSNWGDTTIPAEDISKVPSYHGIPTTDDVVCDFCASPCTKCGVERYRCTC